MKQTVKEILEENNWIIYGPFRPENIVYHKNVGWRAYDGMIHVSEIVFPHAVVIANWSTEHIISICYASPGTALVKGMLMSFRTIFQVCPEENFWEVTSNKWLKTQ